jgi:hypothetical protein
VCAFISNLVVCFGVRCAVTSNRGSQFTSSLWTSTCTKLGLQHILTTTYHPKSNGMVERVHRQIKDALRALAAGPARSSHLPWVLLGLHDAPKEDSGTFSAELVFGSPLLLPCAARARVPPRVQCPVSTCHLLLPGQHHMGRPPTLPPPPIWWAWNMCTCVG